MEFESFYNVKFGKTPKLTRKNGSEIKRKSARHYDQDAINYNQYNDDKEVKEYKQPTIRKNSSTIESRKPDRIDKLESRREDEDEKININGASITRRPLPPLSSYPPEDPTEKLLKPMPGYGNPEFRELAAIITRDIFIQNPNVLWSDIAGLEETKKLIKEAIVFPLKYPNLFTGILSPWKGILLYGQPGTGKTMLAKAIATQCKTTFFNISASSIVSKWRGDSEKLVRTLFELARYHAPSTIFLDEIESIMSHRGNDHEGSRRMKTELLIQMDGLSKTSDHVFLLAASNLPWELDSAMLRRLEKRILIGLPDFNARVDLFKGILGLDLVDGYGSKIVSLLDYEKLAGITEGYSGSDINLVCKEAAMIPLRRVFAALDSQDDVKIERDLVTNEDVIDAVNRTRPSCNPEIDLKYKKWADSFGSI